MSVKIKNFIFVISFFKKNSKIFIVILSLFIILVTTIFYSYFFILREEKTTTSIIFSSSENIRLKPDSGIYVSYRENKSDNITIYLTFEDIEELEESYLYIDSWKLKKKETIHMQGIEELYCIKDKQYVRYCYKIDFQNYEIHSFSQSFTCSLFKDRGGDVKLRLSLYFCNIHGGIPVRIIGLDKFNLETLSPKPDEETHCAIDYIYNPDEEKFKDGIMLRGSNNYLKRKNEFSYFLSGVIIAISASALVTLLIELFKRYEEYRSQVKNYPN